MDSELLVVTSKLRGISLPEIEDNLNTHTKKTLLEVLGEKTGKKIAKKIEWHFTPKHGSWLNQAEIEIHAIEQQCLDRRIADFHTMQSEIAACVRKRNKDKCKIHDLAGYLV